MQKQKIIKEDGRYLIYYSFSSEEFTADEENPDCECVTSKDDAENRGLKDV